MDKVRSYEIASLSCGILSLVIGIIFPYISFLGLILAIVAIALSRVVKRNEESSMAQAGFVTGVIGVVLNVLSFMACVACVGLMGYIFS
ncbi:MAG: hypothetical protein Q4Q17_00220 [Tissierellia bacterium]|nr:hypothetical protein [Tissierellia bacterium]